MQSMNKLINQSINNAIPGNIWTYHSVNTVELRNKGKGYGETPAMEVLNSFHPISLLLSRLQLKISALILLLWNLAP